MNILTTTYFEDFSRYFNFIERIINDEIEQSNFFNISIYPSAHNYWKKSREHSILLPQEVLKTKIKNIDEIIKKDIYKGINLDLIIDFNYKSQKMFNLDKKKELKIQAIKYINYFEKLFNNEKFDLYISSGDTRMLIEIADIFAKRNKVKTLYFEQGPFGTTMLDTEGVNCNISFCKRDKLNSKIDEIKLKKYIENYKINKKEKYWTKEKYFFSNKYEKLRTLLWMHPFNSFRDLFPIDTQLGMSFSEFIKPKILKKINFLKDNKNNQILFPNKAITLILQVPVDAQLINNSPLYDNFFEILKDVHMAIPRDYILVIREHPGNRGKYGNGFYKYINKNKNIELINDLSLKDTLENSELIILNNSTVGIEALTYYKTVITLGKAYYNRKNITYNLDKKENLKKIIRTALKSPIKKEEINIFLYNFIFDYLIEGHFQDLNLEGEKKIKDKLIRILDIGRKDEKNIIYRA